MTNEKVLLRDVIGGRAGASYGGQWYECIDGMIEVPAESVTELTRPIHGFIISDVAPQASKIRKLRA